MVAVLGDIEDDDDDFGEAHDINVTPFIDVMLVLLIIFMVAAPLSTVDLPVDLPSSTAVPQPKPDKPVYVTIKSDLAVAIGETPVKRVDLVSSLDAMSGTVSGTSPGEGKDRRIFLRADRTVPYGELMDVLERLRVGGFNKIALVAQEGVPGDPAQPVCGGREAMRRVGADRQGRNEAGPRTAAAPVADRLDLGGARCTGDPCRRRRHRARRDAAERDRRRSRRAGDRDRRRADVAASRSVQPAGRARYRRVGACARGRRAETGRKADGPAQGRADRDRRSRPRGVAQRDAKARQGRSDAGDGGSRSFGSVSGCRANRGADRSRTHSNRRVRSRHRRAIGESAVRQRATWEKELAAHFNRFKRYPSDRVMQSAEVIVGFVLDRIGHVVSARIIKGSGDASFDEAALAMLQRADPVPAPPPLVADEDLTFSVPVDFRAKPKN